MTFNTKPVTVCSLVFVLWHTMRTMLTESNKQHVDMKVLKLLSMMGHCVNKSDLKFKMKYEL